MAHFSLKASMPLRRPLATAVLLYFAALVCAASLASAFNLTLFIMVTVLGLVTIFIQRESLFVILLCVLPVALGFLVMWHQQIRTQTVADALGTQTCMISGEITDIPRQQYGRWYYTVQTSSIDLPEVPPSLRLRLSSRTSLNAAEGDQITAAVTFLEDTVSNSSHSRTNLLADGIAARAWCLPSAEPAVTAAGTFSRIRFFPLTLRRTIIAAIEAALPKKSAGLLRAMLLGDTDALDQSTVRHFRTSGIGHLLAVSGFHVSLLAAVCTRMTFRLGWRPRQSYLLTMGVILLFMAVTGFTPSVTRAGIMHLMALTAQLFHRNPDPLTSLSLSLLIMLLVRPMIATDIGLQLSVGSSVGIILFADRLKSRLTHR
ncbi:MAG: ComEC/Rec2 family competence protein, partial [Clostridia bacterium]|nr:ComEC/Rec2 family competence protein [Clostridia bacterium]